MRVLVISPFYRWFIKELVEAQAKYVDEINVLVHHNLLSEVSRLPLGGYFNHLRLYNKNNLLDETNLPRNVHLHLLSTIYFIPDGKNKRIGNKLAELFEKYIKEENIKFDVIHAHFAYPQGYVAVKLGRKFGVPVVITTHGHDVYEMPFRAESWKKLITLALEGATHIVTVSQVHKLLLTQKLNIGQERISVIPNGYNPDKFKVLSKEMAREILNLSNDRNIILNVSNLYPVKGHKYLVGAMRQITNIADDILCILVGDGPLRSQLESMVTKMGIKKYVRFIGARPHYEVPLWMNAADIFVLPSLSEGNPTVMFEALGVGLPFVGTAVGGVPEIITSEDYGLLCPPADPKCLAEKILIALEKDWDRKKIREYAQQFTWDNIAKKTLKVYQKVLEQ